MRRYHALPSSRFISFVRTRAGRFSAPRPSKEESSAVRSRLISYFGPVRSLIAEPFIALASQGRSTKSRILQLRSVLSKTDYRGFSHKETPDRGARQWPIEPLRSRIFK